MSRIDAHKNAIVTMPSWMKKRRNSPVDNEIIDGMAERPIMTNRILIVFSRLFDEKIGVSNRIEIFAKIWNDNISIAKTKELMFPSVN